MELRSLRPHGHGVQDSSKKMKYVEKKQEPKKAQTPCLARQALPLPTSLTPSPICLLLEAIDHIKVGSYYEIDHSKLPPSTTPQQLKSIRVVMVSEKGALTVAVRFPSIHSLHTHITEKGYAKPEAKCIPPLSEKYVMPSAIASEALYRRIPPLEIADRSHIWSFWATIKPAAAVRDYQRRSSFSSPELSGDEAMNNGVVSKKGPCWSELKFTGLVKWGNRRKVRYLRRHEPSPSSSSDEEEDAKKDKELMEVEDYGDGFHVDDGDCEKAITVTDEDEDDIEEDDDVKTEEEAEAPPVPPRKMNLRSRKRNRPVRKTNITPKRSNARAKRRKPNQIVAVPEQSSKTMVKLTVARWSAGRYKLAEENMLKVMKAKEATAGNPILRPALRTEARKLIGDTGLLDHLLKHMAGKVAPGGAERFRRRHNADGAMEYWLESADLVNIRKDAGVQDPYWTPPPGWKPGDNPTQDPTCARQIKELKDEIILLRREVQENYVLKKQDDGLAIMTTSNSCLTSVDWDHEGPLSHQKEMYAELMIKRAKIDKQLVEFSHYLSGMQETYGELTIKKAKMEQLQMEVSNSFTGMEEQLGGMVKSSMEEPVTDQRETTETLMRLKNKFASTKPKAKGKEHDEEEDNINSEDKAATIERLRSGFRICRPQGTFLWPSMSMSPNSQQKNDTFKLPIPPSVNTVTVCNVTTKPSTSPSPPILFPPPADESSSKSQTCRVTNPKTPLNLNELPNPIPQNNSCDPTSTVTVSLSRTLTYQRRHHQITTATKATMPPAKKEDGDDDNARKESKDSCSGSESKQQQQQRWCSSTWMGEKCWLAMGTPSPSTPPLDHNIAHQRQS